MADIRRLYDLQALDLTVDRDRQRLQVIAAALGDEGLLMPLRQKAAGLEAAEREAMAQQKELDQAVASIVQHIQQVEAKLYGGAVRNSRELSDLQADLGQLSRQRSQQEERLLEVLGKLEEMRSGLETDRATLREVESAWQREQADMATERDALNAELADLTTRRSTMIGRVPATELALYEQVRRGHSGKAVARIERGACEGCRVGLPTRQQQEARTSATPVRCPNCDLILFVE